MYVNILNLNICKTEILSDWCTNLIKMVHFMQPKNNLEAPDIDMRVMIIWHIITKWSDMHIISWLVTAHSQDNEQGRNGPCKLYTIVMSYRNYRTIHIRPIMSMILCDRVIITSPTGHYLQFDPGRDPYGHWSFSI